MLFLWLANFWSRPDLMSHRCLYVSSLSCCLSYCFLIGPILNFTFSYSQCILVDAYFSCTPSHQRDASWGHHPNKVLWNLMKAGAGRGFVSILPNCSSVLMGTISMVGLVPSDDGCVYSQKW